MPSKFSHPLGCTLCNQPRTTDHYAFGLGAKMCDDHFEEWLASLSSEDEQTTRKEYLRRKEYKNHRLDSVAGTERNRFNAKEWYWQNRQHKADYQRAYRKARKEACLLAEEKNQRFPEEVSQ